jgi:hypothetical protein
MERFASAKRLTPVTGAQMEQPKRSDHGTPARGEVERSL